MLNNILKEHIIDNEEDVLFKIKCKNKNCEYICKKEIQLCNSCKYVELCNPFVTKLLDENIGKKTVASFASETYNSIIFYNSVYKTAKEEGIDVYTMGPLVNFIKKNNLVKERQPNIIIRKISRCRFILKIYNYDKYKNIQDKIKRIFINLNYIPKLDDSQFDIFKNKLINILDIELDKYILDQKNKKINSDPIILKNNIVHEYNCKNINCSKTVNKKDSFCNCCLPDIKICKDCNNNFWTDVIDMDLCDSCYTPIIED